MTAHVALVTGASDGIGRAASIKLASMGWHVVLAVRSVKRTQDVLDEITAAGGSAEICQMDLARLDSVRDAADSILEKHNSINLLINNAGVAGARGLTDDGFEIHFGTNHLAHYLLTRLLLPRMMETSMARIVNVSSRSHYIPKQLDLDSIRVARKSITGLREYAHSKLCNVLFTAELRKRLQSTDVTAVSLHPGQIRSSIWRHIPQPIRWLITHRMLTNEEGADIVLHCALSESVANPTLYYDERRAATPSKVAQDLETALLLWNKSAEWVGLDP